VRLMKWLIVLQAMVLVGFAASCSHEGMEQPKGAKDIQSEAASMLDMKVFIPDFENLEIHTAFVTHRSGEPAMVDVHYAEDPQTKSSDLQTAEGIENWEENRNAKLLYGPYEERENILFSFSKAPAGNYGHEIQVAGERVQFSENSIGPYFVYETEEGHYLFNYLRSSYSNTEAIEKTGDIIEQMKEAGMTP
jgi:hypothetical protein